MLHIRHIRASVQKVTTALALGLILGLSGLQPAAAQPANAQAVLDGLSAAALARIVQPQTLAAQLVDRPDGQVRIIIEFAPPQVPAGVQSTSPTFDAVVIDGVRRAQDRILGRALAPAGGPARPQSDPGLGLRRMPYSPMMGLTADAALLRALAEDPEVVRIHPDRLARPLLTQSLPVIGMPAAIAAGGTGHDQMVAVLDSGARLSHEFLNSRITLGACFNSNIATQGSSSRCPGGATSSTTLASGDDCTSSSIAGCGHGTHVAGIAGGFIASPAAGRPAHGVARDARILSINVFSQFSGSNCGSSSPCILSWDSDQIAALNHVFSLRNSHSFAAVNMSLGSGQESAYCSTAPIRSIIQQLTTAGIAVVIAAGNDGYNAAVAYPACVPEAVTVASTTNTDTRSVFDGGGGSNWGTLVDIAAPGSGILASYISGTSNTHYAALSGTSMAAPHVAGAFAAIRTVHPTATVAQILSALRDTGTSVTSSGVAIPRINVDQAIAVLSGSPLPPPAPTPQNDDFANRTVIIAPGTYTGSNVNATREANEPAHQGGSPTHDTSVWWSLTAGAAGQVTIDTCGSNFDTILAVYTGNSVAALTPVQANDDFCGYQSQVQFNATAGTTYQIAVVGWRSETGNILLNVAFPSGPAATTTVLTGTTAATSGQAASYTATVTSVGGSPTGTVSFRRGGTEFASAPLNGSGVATASNSTFPVGTHQITAVYLGAAGFATSTSQPVTTVISFPPPPPNNLFANRITIPAPGTVAGTNVGATAEPDQPLIYGANWRNAVWWRFTPTQNGTVTINTQGSNFPTILAIFTGQQPANLQSVTEAVSPGGVQPAQVSFVAVAGTEYQIAIAGLGNESGSITLNLSLAPTGPVATTTTLTGNASAMEGQQVWYTATVTAPSGTPGGTVSFRRGGVQFATAPLNVSGVASTSIASFPVGTHQVNAAYLGTTGFTASTSPAVTTVISAAPTGPVEFLGGGVVHDLNEACEPSLGQSVHPVRIRYAPADLNRLPSEISIIWPQGSENLALWGDFLPSSVFQGGAGRQIWTVLGFYTTRPAIRTAQRVITQPHGGTNLATAQELVLRLRVRQFGATPGCVASISGTLRRLN